MPRASSVDRRALRRVQRVHEALAERTWRLREVELRHPEPAEVPLPALLLSVQDLALLLSASSAAMVSV